MNDFSVGCFELSDDCLFMFVEVVGDLMDTVFQLMIERDNDFLSEQIEVGSPHMFIDCLM